MPAQIQKGETFTDTAPNYEVSSTRLNNHVASAILLPGAISEQTLVASTSGSDLTIINQGGTLKSVTLSNLNAPGGVSATQLVESNRQSVHQYAVGGLSTGVYAVALSPAATAYTAGMVVRFKADSANLGAVDINVNGLGVKNLLTNVSEELAANYIRASHIVEAVYDGTNFQVISLPWKAYLTGDQFAASGTAIPGALMQSGAPIQTVATSTSSLIAITAATPGGTIPIDNTIPASNEGQQILSQAITAASTSNVLDIEVVVPVAAPVVAQTVAASLLQDGVCVAASASTLYPTSPESKQIVIRHRQTAGTTSATTFTVRVGTTASTVSINATPGGGALFGGVSNAWLIIRELKA